MFTISVLEYETNNNLGSIELPAIPRVGEFFIMDDVISEDWKQKFYIVRSVTYLLGGGVCMHLQKHDIDESIRKDKELKDKLKELLQKAKKGE